MSSNEFKSLKINENILRAITEMGFENPTAIQTQAIPLLLETTKDFIGQAQTGTGKTAAFAIPILEQVDINYPFVQALILAPTRELALQIQTEIEKIAVYTGVESQCVYGGMPYDRQIRNLKRNKPHIVVGTPGRVIDLISKGALIVKKTRFCVLDEADEMLKMGFIEDIQTVLDILPDSRQLVMFSATMPTEIIKLIQKSFNEYEMVKIKKATLSHENIEQKYFVVKEKYFKESVDRLIKSEEDVYGIIFCKTKLETKDVGDFLRGRGHLVEVLNGDMGQNERDHAMRNFRSRKVNIMVCTDVAARGIDVNSLTHVINLGLPQDNESYVHRIGRTGRAGMKGQALTIVGQSQAFIIKKIERHIKARIEKAKLPEVADLKKSLIQRELQATDQIISALHKKGEEFEVDPAFDLFKARLTDLGQEELLKLMFTWKFNKDLRHLDNLSDIEANEEERRRSDRGQRRGRSDRRSGGRSGNRSSRNSSRSSRSSESGSGRRRSFQGERKGRGPSRAAAY